MEGSVFLLRLILNSLYAGILQERNKRKLKEKAQLPVITSLDPWHAQRGHTYTFPFHSCDSFIRRDSGCNELALANKTNPKNSKMLMGLVQRQTRDKLSVQGDTDPSCLPSCIWRLFGVTIATSFSAPFFLDIIITLDIYRSSHYSNASAIIASLILEACELKSQRV